MNQRMLDEMVLKAREIAQARVEDWQVVWLADRHPDNFKGDEPQTTEPPMRDTAEGEMGVSQ